MVKQNTWVLPFLKFLPFLVTRSIFSSYCLLTFSSFLLTNCWLVDSLIETAVFTSEIWITEFFFLILTDHYIKTKFIIYHYPVDTRRCLDGHSTSFERNERQMDVKTTLCSYSNLANIKFHKMLFWRRFNVLNVIDVWYRWTSNNVVCLQKNLLTQDVIRTSIQRFMYVMDVKTTLCAYWINSVKEQ